MKKAIIIVILILFCSKIDAQIKVKLFEYNKKIAQWNVSDTSEMFIKIKKYIKRQKAKGYVLASVDSIKYDSTSVNVYFYKGCKYYRGKITVNIDNKDTFNLSNFSKKTANTDDIQKEAKKLADNYLNSGYPFAKAEISSIKFDNNFITANIDIKKGKYIYFDSIFFDKNAVDISEKFLANYLNFKHKKPFNQQITNDVAKKIDNLSFLENQSPPEIEFHKSSVDLYLYLKKRKNSQISGILSFTNVNNKFELVGQAEVNLVNIFKSADNINFTWKHLKSLSQNFNTKILLPYLFGTKFGINENLFIEKIDTSYVNFNNNLKINYFWNGLNNLGASYNFQRSIVLNNSQELTDFFSATYGIYINLSEFNNPLNPSKGYKINFELSTGQKKHSDTTVNQTFSSSEIIYVMPIKKHLALFFKNTTTLLQSPYIFENELVKFGGNNLMRGFDEESLSASYLSVSSLELRFLFAKNSNAFIFSDYAIFRHQTTITDYWQHPLGIGTGINLSTKSGILSLSLALGKLDNENFNFSDMKVHLGFKTLF